MRLCYRPISSIGQWCGDAEIAWPIIRDRYIQPTTDEIQQISGAWLNSGIHELSVAVDKSTRNDGAKDAGWIVTVLVESKSPLGGFAESSFRRKTANFNPSRRWVATETKPPNHQIMLKIGYLISEMDKCAASMSPSNVKNCVKFSDVCKSHVQASGQFGNILNTLPTKAIEACMERMEKSENDKQTMLGAGGNYSDQVEQMADAEDFVEILVNFVSAAKCEEKISKMEAICQAIANALDAYDWK